MKKYLIEWTKNGYSHNGTFEATGFRDLIEQLKLNNIHPCNIVIQGET